MNNSNFVKVITFILLLTNSYISFANDVKTTKTSTAYCLRCHSMETLAYRDTLTGKIVNLYVNPQQYKQSNHKSLECIACHTPDYSNYPHPESVKSENLYCLDCHKDEPKFIHYRFAEIEQTFKNSIHASQAQFTCFSCHNPHQFKVSHVGENISDIVRQDNEICLNCHASPLYQALNRKGFTQLIISHQWLPNPQLHWRSVRCLECHSQAGTHHKILAAKNSVKNCVECHSKEATLLSSLYKYRSQEDLQKAGWFNKAVFNNAYIIGMSRNETVDHWSLIILVLTITGLFAHGLGRFFANKKRGNTK
jgi:hypothetical protein